MNKKVLFIFMFFSTIGFGQTLSLDQSYNVNYSFDLGKYAFGLIENQDKSVFCYGDFGIFSNLDLRYGILFDSIGNVVTNFIITPPSNQPIIHAQKTNYGYFLHTAGEGFQKIDEFGNEFLPGYQLNIISNLPSSLLNGCLESYNFTNGKTLAGCFPDPCVYPPVNPSSTFYLYRLTNDGHYDSTFSHNTDGPVQFVKSFDDSVLFISGSFTAYDNFNITNVAKIDIDGVVDTSFQSIFISGDVYPAYIQPDGKIIFTGSFVIQNMSDTFGIVRVNADGTLDQTFNNSGLIINQFTGFGYLTAAHSVCPTPDGGYLIGGRFSNYQNNPRGCIVKTDHNGFIDVVMLAGSGFDSSPFPSLGIPPAVTDIISGSNDKYYVSGFFDGFNGQNVKPLIRLNGLLTNTSEVESKEEFQIFPNPSSMFIYVSSIDNQPLDDCEIIITDYQGKVLIQNHLDQLVAYADISNLTSGFYIVKLMSNSRTFIKKIQVVH